MGIIQQAVDRQTKCKVASRIVKPSEEEVEANKE